MAAQDSEVFSLYIANIPRNLSQSEVEELFENEQGLIEVKLHRDRDTGAFKGVAFANFRSLEGAQNCIKKYHNTMQWDSKLIVDFSEKTKQRIGVKSDKMSLVEELKRETKPTKEKRESEINKTLCIVAPIEILIGTLVDMKESKTQIKRELSTRMTDFEYEDVKPVINELTDRVIQRRERLQ